MLRYLTAGESHGPVMTAILEGLPSGIMIENDFIDRELSRRQKGPGRGERMKIEADKIEILSGVYENRTIGSPIALMIKNTDAAISKKGQVFCPRPGHADLAGGMKYDLKDMRYVLERSSARETVARVAVGALCKKFLMEFDIAVLSRVVKIGGVCVDDIEKSCKEVLRKVKQSSVRSCEDVAEKEIIAIIDKAKERKDTLGGVFEIILSNPVVGLGSYTHWDRRLDGNLARSLMSIQAIKGVEIGLGFDYADKSGSEVHDEIFYNKKSGFYRKTNNAGGLEGGVTNGEDIVLRAGMKPIPTLGKPLKTVNIKDKSSSSALKERADVCAVHAAAVVGEAVVAFEITRSFREKFGGDSLGDVKKSYEQYVKRIKNF